MKDFHVKITEDFGKPLLSITHNGYQWASIPINDPREEIPHIVSTLNQYLESIKDIEEAPVDVEYAPDNEGEL